MCQFSVELKEVQMAAHCFKLNKGLLFAQKLGNINVSKSAAPKPAFVPASRYNCGVKSSYVNVCAKLY